MESDINALYVERNPQHYIIMSTRYLFLPFLVALAGFVSCDEFKPEVAVGCVTVDNEYSCALTSAIGGDIRPFAKFVISILRQNDFL